MSTDVLVQRLNQLEVRLHRLHSSSHLFAALSNLEGEGYRSGDLIRAIQHLLVNRTDIRHNLSHSETHSQRSHFALAIFGSPFSSQREIEIASGLFANLAQVAMNLVHDLPNSVLRRLGFESSHPIESDWIRCLFHFAWQFPNAMNAGGCQRVRILQIGEQSNQFSKEFIQFWGLPDGAVDLFPGIILSVTPMNFDLVTATIYALALIKKSLCPVNPLTLTDEFRKSFATLKDDFEFLGRFTAQSHGRRRDPVKDVKLLRLASSFETLSVTIWAGIKQHPRPRLHFLSRRNSERECCVFSDQSYDSFFPIADRAGALIPSWAETPYPSVMSDAYTWRNRVERCRTMENDSLSFQYEDGSIRDLSKEEKSQLIQNVWNEARMDPFSFNLVTDDRGNIERWLGFVFAIFKEYAPEELELSIFPDDGRIARQTWNGIMTFQRLNIFEASSKALELSRFLPSIEPTKSSEKPKKPVSKKGRRPVSTINDDIIYREWCSSKYQSYAELGKKLGISAKEISRVVSRFRMRKKKSEKNVD